MQILNICIYTLDQQTSKELLSSTGRETQNSTCVHTLAFLTSFDRILKAGQNGNGLGGFLTTSHSLELLHLSKMQAWAAS